VGAGSRVGPEAGVSPLCPKNTGLYNCAVTCFVGYVTLGLIFEGVS